MDMLVALHVFCKAVNEDERGARPGFSRRVVCMGIERSFLVTEKPGSGEGGAAGVAGVTGHGRVEVEVGETRRDGGV